MTEYEHIHLPPDLSEADRRLEREIKGELGKLYREYLDRSQPLTNQLAKIHARYLPRVMIVPKDDKNTTATKV